MLVIVTVPLKIFLDDKYTSPLIETFLQSTNDGKPPRVAASRSCTNLYFLESKSTIGAIPLHAGFNTNTDLESTKYASERKNS